jgi:hypothetical protein
MPTYPLTIRRCQHIKVNGIQCGSPAKRNERHCFFHEQCRVMSREINMKFTEHGIIKLPTLEDANSIQLGLAEVMRLLVTHQIDHRIASLLLRALRTAAANVKFTSLEPKKPTHIVIDPSTVENRPLGATAWSTVEGQDYDTIADTNDADNNDREGHAQEGQEREGHESEKESIMDLDDANNPVALEYRAHMLRITAAVKADPNAIHLSAAEIYQLHPSTMSQTHHLPISQQPDPKPPLTTPEKLETPL